MIRQISNMIVGDLSGIQDFLFSVARHGKGQARRLRAHSFLLRLIPEAAILRLRQSIHGRFDVIWNAAGKFGIAIEESHDNQEAVAREYWWMSEWLRDYAGAGLRLSIALCPTAGTPQEQNFQAHTRLLREKFMPWRILTAGPQGWEPGLLVLPPLAPPCDLCKQRQARNGKNLCLPCQQEEEIGGRLPDAECLVVHAHPSPGSFSIFDFHFTLHDKLPSKKSTEIMRYALKSQPLENVSGEVSERRLLVQNVPQSNGQVLDFDALAAQASGIPYLGVLKMDVDSLGAAFGKAMEHATDWKPYQSLSKRLNEFFTVSLHKELRQPAWKHLYPIFGGGDDLLMAGPWDVTFDFAGRIRSLFSSEFGAEGLTLSTGIALIPRKQPILQGVLQADELLDQAKQGNKNQCAAFGQIWEWKDHEIITHWAKSLAFWVENNAAERGWLQTWLRLIRQRDGGDPLAEAHLAYHITRNYPKTNDPNPQKAALRKWVDEIARNFTQQRRTETRYLSAIVQYALTATRNQNEEK